MRNRAARMMAIAALMLPLAAAAEPVEIRLAYYGSEDTNSFRYGVKPFVDGVNAEGSGLLRIRVLSNGVLGPSLAEQPRLALGGTADIAWIAPGQTPYRFPDSAVVELPGLFRDAREGTLAYSRLIAAKALQGYEDYFVIGTFMSEPAIIHSRKPIGSLAALNGQRIRANNQVIAEVLERMGALPTVLESSKIAVAITRGTIDGTAMNPNGIFDFHAAEAVRHHFFLRTGATPLALVMNRKKYESLSDAAKALIAKYSGERAAATWIRLFGAREREAFEMIKSQAGRTLVEPTQSDLETAQRIYQTLIGAWAAKSPRNRQLLQTVRAELTAIRSGQ